jgi:tRNA (cmo5U34)-methyltransferase
MRDNKSAHNSGVYDDRITSVLPYYREYHAQIIDLVDKLDIPNPNWLDTGCGTGTLAARVFENRDDVRFTLADPSGGMLEKAKEKLSGRDVAFINQSSLEISFTDEYDIVTAVQSHHYLQKDERKRAVQNCYEALKESGLFVTFENICMSDPKSDEIAMRRWVAFLEEHGNTPEEVQVQKDRRGVETLPITIEEHINLLRDCGFRSVDMLWTSYLQAGFWAIK